MATINENAAKALAENNGIYPGDPQCYAIFKYYNNSFCKECFAVAYDQADFARYAGIYDIIEILFAQNRQEIDSIIVLCGGVPPTKGIT